MSDRVTITKAGWVVETTDMANDCLVQGGVCGRKDLYTWATLAKIQLWPGDDPADDYNDYSTNEAAARQLLTPDRCIRRGVEIE